MTFPERIQSRKFICWSVMTVLSTVLLCFGIIPPETWYGVVGMGGVYMAGQSYVDGKPK